MLWKSLSSHDHRHHPDVDHKGIYLTLPRSTPPSNEMQLTRKHASRPVYELHELPLLNAVDSNSTNTEPEDEANAVEVDVSSSDCRNEGSGRFTIKMKPLPRASHNAATSSGRCKEWVPLMLRKSSTTSLALFLWTHAIALEVVHTKIRKIDGIDIDDRVAANSLKYVPTVTAILLGLGWKALVSDVKKITPWAAISSGWRTPNQSLLLNYIDDLDIKSAYVAARSRHWPLFLALAGGLLSGALVPLGNALFYTDLQALTSRQVTLQTQTAFELNGTLTMPVDYRSTLQQAELSNEVTALTGYDHNFLPWTYRTYAFESFGHAEYGRETILQNKVTAFTSSLACRNISYISVYDNDGSNSTVAINADRGSLDTAGCPGNVVQMVKQAYNTSIVESFFRAPSSSFNVADSVVSSTAWFNVTDCGQPLQYRILVNVIGTGLSLTGSANTILPADVNISAAGLLCEPQYYLVSATLYINAASAKVIDFNTT
jgi:Protein of unknown function (DUF3433)